MALCGLALSGLLMAHSGDYARRWQYLWGFHEPARHRALLEADEIWPGFAKERVGSGILMNIVGHPNELIVRNGEGLPEYTAAGIPDLARAIESFSAATVRPLAYLEEGGRALAALEGRKDSLRAEGEAGLVLAAIPYEEIMDKDASPGVPELASHLFLCAAMANAGEDGKPLTLAFSPATLIAADGAIPETITVEHGNLTAVVPFPGRFTLPALEKGKLIKLQMNGTARKVGPVFLNPEE